MAGVPCVINGVIVDLYGRVILGPVKIMGEFARADVGIGGGPILPPPEEKPPGIPGHPAHPIWGAPVDPGYGVPGPPYPPGEKPPIDPGRPTFPIWGPPGTVFPPGPGYPPVAGHPLPEPPNKPPEPVQPPIEWKAVWVPGEGWVVVGIPNFPHPAPSA